MQKMHDVGENLSASLCGGVTLAVVPRVCLTPQKKQERIFYRFPIINLHL